MLVFLSLTLAAPLFVPSQLSVPHLFGEVKQLEAKLHLQLNPVVVKRPWTPEEQELKAQCEQQYAKFVLLSFLVIFPAVLVILIRIDQCFSYIFGLNRGVLHSPKTAISILENLINRLSRPSAPTSVIPSNSISSPFSALSIVRSPFMDLLYRCKALLAYANYMRPDIVHPASVVLPHINELLKLLCSIMSLLPDSLRPSSKSSVQSFIHPLSSLVSSSPIIDSSSWIALPFYLAQLVIVDDTANRTGSPHILFCQQVAFQELSTAVSASPSDVFALNCLGKCFLSGYGCQVDVDRALQLFVAASEKGNITAQYNVSFSVSPKNVDISVFWSRKAAAAGHAGAQYNLGRCYHLGEGVSKNEVEAARWYRMAADQGDAEAQNTLGLCLEKGLGAAKDESQAVTLYRKAAEQGLDLAACNLARCLQYGIGAERNLAEARRWFQLAADLGHTEARSALRALSPDEDR